MTPPSLNLAPSSMMPRRPSLPIPSPCSSASFSTALPSYIPLSPSSQRPNILPPSHLYSRLPPHAFLQNGQQDDRGRVPDYMKLILTSRVYEVVKETPLMEGVELGRRLGVWVGLKREDCQAVFSFKIRGAYNLMAHLTEEEQWKGIVACSAGNHAQGVALSARSLGMAATIVMPVATPSIKYNNVASLGAKVVLHGDDFDAAKLECARLVKEHGLIDIPPYDDPYIIAGQGTVAMEILRQTNVVELEAIFVCVGGGGLLAGIAAYVKRIAPPHVKIIGVEARDQTAMTQSLLNGRREVLPEVGLFCDGTAVRVVGEETFRVCSELVDGIVLVTNDEVCAAIKDIFQDTRSVLEPSGALAVAGLKRYVESQGLVGSDKRFVAVTSGANMNFDRLRFVAERAALGEGKEALMSVVVPEKPGSFVRLHSYIHPRAITEFSYRYSSPLRAYIFTSFQVSGTSADPTLSPQEARQKEIDSVIEAITKDPGGMVPRDISDNEMAKTHARYLAGGRKKVQNERLISFAFPERPGALRKFLVGLGGTDNGGPLFNVTLFHYRNHGSDISRVLAGIQVTPEETDRFVRFLRDLRYPYVDETENDVYRHFLAEED